MEKHTKTGAKQEKKAARSERARIAVAEAPSIDGLNPPRLSRLVEELWLHQQELEVQNKTLLEVQSALEASRDQYALLYDAAPVGYLTLEASGRIHQSNLTAATLLGADRARLPGSLLTSHLTRADAAPLLAHLAEAIRAEHTVIVEVALRKQTSERALVRLQSGPMHSAVAHGRALCLTAMIDITQTRQLQDERERMERKLQDTQRLESLGVLAGGIAHDFNNLLAVILGRASLGTLKTDLDPELRDHFCQIETAAERATDLCKQMMAYSGRSEFSSRSVDLNALLQGEERLLRASIHHGTRLDFDLQTELPPVQGDPTQLRQLIMNLVTNASESRALRDARVLVRTCVATATRAELATAQIGGHLNAGNYVSIEVRDNGEGMDAQTVSKIFEPFFSTKFAGRGLGLAVVLGIVRRHGGALRVDSSVGAGSAFRCWLPIAPRVPVAEAGGDTSSAALGAGTILLVDDDDAVRETTAAMLKHLGFDVLSAASGKQALALFAQHGDSVRGVLSDLSMPEMDGRELLRALLRENPSVRVLLMSGFGRREALRGFGRAPPLGFVQKPLHLEALRIALEKLFVAPLRASKSSN